MATNEALTSLLDDFLSCVPSLGKPEHRLIKRKEQRANPTLFQDMSWKNRVGIYYFINPSGDVVYIGKAQACDLNARISDQLRSGTGGPWGTIVADDDTTIGSFAFRQEEWYWLLSLEAFLIDKLKPIHNHRTG